MDRTSALDSAFLHVESPTAALHIGSVAVFEGPVPTHREVLEAIGRTLPLAPRFRQRLVKVPFAIGRPVWVDDPEFDLGRHVHRVAAGAPGGTEELRAVAERLFSAPLDHDAPLWEDWVVEGLADGRWALVSKVHHTMVDGIAGTDLLTTLLDGAAEAEVGPWRPAPLPNRARLVSDAVRENVALRVRELRGVPALVGSTARSAARPRAALESARAGAGGLLAFARNARPTADSSLVGSLGRDRGYAWTEVDLATVLAIHDRLGGTINDLVLGVVAGAYRSLLLARGEPATQHSVRTLVPVSVRRNHERGVLDNRVSAIVAELPVELADPRERHVETSIRMRALKESHEAQVGERVTGLADVLPPMPLAAFLHLAFRVPHRNLTTVVTNVPGPQRPLHLAGRRMLATYPYVPIADRLRTGVAVTSYDGRLLFGVTSDRESTPDAHVLVGAIGSGFEELAALVGPGPVESAVAR